MLISASLVVQFKFDGGSCLVLCAMCGGCHVNGHGFSCPIGHVITSVMLEVCHAFGDFLQFLVCGYSNSTDHILLGCDSIPASSFQ